MLQGQGPFEVSDRKLRCAQGECLLSRIRVNRGLSVFAQLPYCYLQLIFIYTGQRTVPIAYLLTLSLETTFHTAPICCGWSPQSVFLSCLARNSWLLLTFC